MDTTSVLEEWRFFTMESGEQCVMICGIQQTRQWCVENWAVGMSQRQRALLILDKVLDKYGWMMFSAVGMNLH